MRFKFFFLPLLAFSLLACEPEGLVNRQACTQVETTFDLGGGCQLFVPNIFTPNDDGINEGFGVKMSCTPEAYSLRIFTSIGTELFATDRLPDSWDAATPTGVYEGLFSYRIEVVVNGDTLALEGDATSLPYGAPGTGDYELRNCDACIFPDQLEDNGIDPLTSEPLQAAGLCL